MPCLRHAGEILFSVWPFICAAALLRLSVEALQSLSSSIPVCRYGLCFSRLDISVSGSFCCEIELCFMRQWHWHWGACFLPLPPSLCCGGLAATTTLCSLIIQTLGEWSWHAAAPWASCLLLLSQLRHPPTGTAGHTMYICACVCVCVCVFILCVFLSQCVCVCVRERERERERARARERERGE